MLKRLLKTVFGDPGQRELKRIQPIVDQVNALEPEIKALSDEELLALTSEFRDLLSQETDDLRSQLAELESERDREQDE